MPCGNSQVVDVRFVIDIFAFNNLNLKVIFHPGDSFEQHQSVVLRHLRHSSAEMRLPTPVLTGLKEREFLFFFRAHDWIACRSVLQRFALSTVLVGLALECDT